MKTNQLVHSFYTKNLSMAHLFVHVICFTASYLYAKRSGFKINLHTDKQGYKYLHNLPYDNIFVDLEDAVLPAKRMYAAVKFKVMHNYPVGTIHIDGDVFLKSPQIIDIFNAGDCDLIVQSVEKPPIWGYFWKESAESLKNCEYPDWANRECNIMYNCGVVGIFNDALRSEYYDTYWTMYERYLKDGIDMPSIPDVVVEQQFLYDLCKAKGYKVKTLIDGECPNRTANAIGYQHVIGVSKIKEYKQILKTIKRLDENVYNELKDKFYELFRSCWC